VEKIGEGWQFKVYDRGSRVEKVPKSRFEITVSIVSDCPEMIFKPFKLRSEVKRISQERSKAFNALENDRMPKEMVSGAEIDEGVLIQDKVEVIEDRFSDARLSERKKVIDIYIDFVIECWRYGFSETTYNFTINHGLEEDEDLVLLDIGELTFSKEKIVEDIKDEKWLEKAVYTDFLSEDLKPYFKKRMKEEITVEKLEDKWKEKC
jgi:hypothetical protein